jgi:hypothetical protein
MDMCGMDIKHNKKSYGTTSKKRYIKAFRLCYKKSQRIKAVNNQAGKKQKEFLLSGD